jgi:DNA-binding transcriptional regulator YhcF (GntR family)
VLEQVWPGHSGAYDRAVLLGHIEIAERAGRLTYQAGVRDLAEQTGVSIQAASNANRRLSKRQLIERVRESKGTLAAMWKLNACAASKLDTPIEPMCRGVSTFVGVEIQHDVFRWAGLGKCAAHVWAELTISPKAVAAPALAAATGRGNRTVERALERMRVLGMVRGDPGENGVVWSAVQGVNLDEIASKLGTSGMGVRQRAEHVRQRENHRVRLRRRSSFEKPRP